MKQIARTEWRLIERPIKTKDGRSAIALVALLCVGDRVLKAEIVDIRVREEVKGSKKTLRLCAERKASPAPEIKKQRINSIKSPYFNTLLFLVSQPARAPSHKN